MGSDVASDTAPLPDVASGRWWATRVGLAAFLLVVAGIGARATYGARTSADEPQYLLTALSIAEDGDLDIANQLSAGAYREFHETALPTQTALREDGSRLSPHNPLLPAFLALPTALGGWAAAKAAVAVLAAATAAATAWTATRRFGVSRRTAETGALLMAASPPLAFYATQIYPEMAAALLLVVSVASLTGPDNRRSRAAAAAAVAALPWLAVKYVPLAAVLAGAMLWRMRRRPAALAGWGAAWAAMGAAYLIFNQATYGGWTPYAAGDFFTGGEFTALGAEPNWPGRSVRLLGLLTDRGFGLAAWQPAFLALIPAAAAAAAGTRFPGRWLLLAAAGTGWLTATFIAQTMHGWWWPGRQTAAAVPVMALLIMKWADGLPRTAKAGWAAAAAAGALAYAWLAAEATIGARALIVDFTRTSNPLYRIWSAALPDYLHQTAATWVRHGLWLAAAAGLAWLGARSVGERRRRREHSP